jgi:PAS domain S-box-containing protein
MKLAFRVIWPMLAVAMALIAYFSVGPFPQGFLSPRLAAVTALSLQVSAAAVLTWTAIRSAVTAPLSALRVSCDTALAPSAAVVHRAEGDEIGAVAQRVAELKEVARSRGEALERVTQQLSRAESSLRESEERYALAIRSANDGLWEWELERNTIAFSPRWRAMLGVSTDDTMSHAKWLELIHPDDRNSFETALAAHLAGSADRIEHQHRMQHRDGSHRWILSRGCAIRHASGKPYRVVGLDTDITAVKRVETVLGQIVAGTTDAFGDTFFRAMVKHFAMALQVPIAFVTECADYPTTRMRTLAFWSDSDFADNFEYPLAGAPCEEVVAEGRTCFYPSRVAERYPLEAGYESYLGVPIFGIGGRLIGHLVFLDRKVMTDDILVDAVFRIFAARAAAEIERRAIADELNALRGRMNLADVRN